MKACLFVFLASLACNAAAYRIKADGVNCRSGPGTTYGVKRTFDKGDDVTITCQTEGTEVFGSTIWDKTSYGCYVADYYVKTNSVGYVKPKCDAPPTPKPNIPGPSVNDYPYKNNCNGNGGIDPWLYYRCECTSFVAWRINKRLGIKFHNKYRGAAWGHAKEWYGAALKTGVKVNNSPKPGSVAVRTSGEFGHVAWVTKVSGNSVTVEEYNAGGTHKYRTQTYPKSTFEYIHLKT